MVQVVEDAVENGEVKRLVGQLAGVGDPSDNVRLQHRHVALNGVLVQDRQGRLRQFPRPLRRRSLSGKQTNKLQSNQTDVHRFNLSRALDGSEEYFILFLRPETSK